MGVERINGYQNRTEEQQQQSRIRQDEVQNPRRNFVVEKSKKTDANKETTTTADIWSDDSAREQTFEELKTLVRAIQSGETDPFKLTDLIFYARHPDLVGQSLADKPEMLDEWNAISALLVHPTLNEVSNILGTNIQEKPIGGATEMKSAFERASQSNVVNSNVRLSGVSNTLYDDIIARAVQWCPGLSPQILKSLLAQESNFRPTVINKYGYAGIAQFGRPAAREVGLYVGVAGSATDERLQPDKAIPGAAKLLSIKAKRLGEIAFSKYGQPTGVNFWKFVLAAYNGGEGTVSVAMGHAYRVGIEKARAQGLVGEDVVRFARNYASNWENLKIGGMGSPLGMAAARFFPSIATQKYHEIGNYPTQIVARVKA